MPRVNVKVKNMNDGEVYFEMEFDQNTGCDYAMGSNVGSQYTTSNQVTHISLDLTGERITPPVLMEEQLTLGLS